MRKVLPWLVVALLIVLIVRNPAGSAATVRSLWASLVDLGGSFASFISHVVSG